MAQFECGSYGRATLIKNGMVYDPHNNITNKSLDVFLSDGKVVIVKENISQQELLGHSPSWQEFDASGCLVCPGLIDLHIHCFPGRTTLGIDPDLHCLARGVTTVIDAGSSGSNDFEEFLEYIKSRKIRVLALLHVSKLGLTTAGCATDAGAVGELESIEDVDIKSCVSCLQAHPQTVVGTKLRLSSQLADNGKNELEALRRALKIRQDTGLPLMVHHSFSTIPLSPSADVELGVPSHLVSGDIRTHMYHGFETNIVDRSTGCVDKAVVESRLRGVLSDLGHGQGGFSWTVAEIAAKEKVWPDAISTDIHTGNVNGPAYDLPTVMSKLLHVGMPLASVIEAVTSSPARIIQQSGKIGSLSCGVAADVTVLRLEDCDHDVEDTQGQVRRVSRMFSPVAVWRAGERIELRNKEFPNTDPDYLVKVKTEQALLQVYDDYMA